MKAVVARSFERIHRANLVGMGVLPLQFRGADSWQSLGTDRRREVRRGARRRAQAAAGRDAGDPPRRRHRTRTPRCCCASTRRSRSTTTSTAASCPSCCASCWRLDSTWQAADQRLTKRRCPSRASAFEPVPSVALSHRDQGAQPCLVGLTIVFENSSHLYPMEMFEVTTTAPAASGAAWARWPRWSLDQLAINEWAIGARRCCRPRGRPGPRTGAAPDRDRLRTR